MTWFEITCWITVVVWFLATFPAWYGILFPRFVRDIDPLPGEQLPSLSIIVPARLVANPS